MLTTFLSTGTGVHGTMSKRLIGKSGSERRNAYTKLQYFPSNFKCERSAVSSCEINGNVLVLQIAEKYQILNVIYLMFV